MGKVTAPEGVTLVLAPSEGIPGEGMEEGRTQAPHFHEKPWKLVEETHRLCKLSGCRVWPSESGHCHWAGTLPTPLGLLGPRDFAPPLMFLELTYLLYVFMRHSMWLYLYTWCNDTPGHGPTYHTKYILFLCNRTLSKTLFLSYL